MTVSQARELLNDGGCITIKGYEFIMYWYSIADDKFFGIDRTGFLYKYFNWYEFLTPELEYEKFIRFKGNLTSRFFYVLKYNNENTKAINQYFLSPAQILYYLSVKYGSRVSSAKPDYQIFDSLDYNRMTPFDKFSGGAYYAIPPAREIYDNDIPGELQVNAYLEIDEKADEKAEEKIEEKIEAVSKTRFNFLEMEE